MRNSRLIEENRLLNFLDEEKATVVPPELFNRKTVKKLQAFELVEITPSGACVLTGKGKYIKKMTSNPKIELHTQGNYILNLKLKKEGQQIEEVHKVKTRSRSSVLTTIISAILLPFHLLRMS